MKNENEDSAVGEDEDKYHRDYRTKRVILEIYDALAAAKRSGKP